MHGVVAANQSEAAHDCNRPRFHVAPKTGWLNDPNGPCYFNGQTHMCVNDSMIALLSHSVCRLSHVVAPAAHASFEAQLPLLHLHPYAHAMCCLQTHMTYLL